MSGRLPSGVLIGALRRRVSEAGGFATILAKGDEQGGAILVVTTNRGDDERLYERGLGSDGRTTLIDSTPKDDPTGYWHRRRARDPDLWVIELDIPDAQRFAAETLIDD